MPSAFPRLGGRLTLTHTCQATETNRATEKHAVAMGKRKLRRQWSAYASAKLYPAVRNKKSEEEESSDSGRGRL